MTDKKKDIKEEDALAAIVLSIPVLMNLPVDMMPVSVRFDYYVVDGNIGCDVRFSEGPPDD